MNTFENRRLELGISRKELAKQSGVSLASVYTILDFGYALTITGTTVYRVASVLGFDIVIKDKEEKTSILTKRRLELGMSVEALAKWSNLCPVTVCKILSNKNGSKIHSLVAVAKAMGLQVADVLIDEDVSASVFLRQRAEVKARLIVTEVQRGSPNTSYAALAKLEKQTISELLSGPRDKLW